MKRLHKVIVTAGALGLSAIGFVAASGPASAAVCNDGWYSSSSGRGTCSWHGGISGNDYSYGFGNSYGGSKSYGNSYGGSNSYSDPFGSSKNYNYGYGGGYGSGSKYNDPFSLSNGFGSSKSYGNSFGGSSLGRGSLSGW